MKREDKRVFSPRRVIREFDDSFAPEPNPEIERIYSELSAFLPTANARSRRGIHGRPKAEMKKAHRPTATAFLHPNTNTYLAGSAEKKRMPRSS